MRFSAEVGKTVARVGTRRRAGRLGIMGGNHKSIWEKSLRGKRLEAAMGNKERRHTQATEGMAPCWGNKGWARRQAIEGRRAGVGWRAQRRCGSGRRGFSYVAGRTEAQPGALAGFPSTLHGRGTISVSHEKEKKSPRGKVEDALVL